MEPQSDSAPTTFNTGNTADYEYQKKLAAYQASLTASAGQQAAAKRAAVWAMAGSGGFGILTKQFADAWNKSDQSKGLFYRFGYSLAHALLPGVPETVRGISAISRAAHNVYKTSKFVNGSRNPQDMMNTLHYIADSAKPSIREPVQHTLSIAQDSMRAVNNLYANRLLDDPPPSTSEIAKAIGTASTQRLMSILPQYLPGVTEEHRKIFTNLKDLDPKAVGAMAVASAMGASPDTIKDAVDKTAQVQNSTNFFSALAHSARADSMAARAAAKEGVPPDRSYTHHTLALFDDANRAFSSPVDRAFQYQKILETSRAFLQNEQARENDGESWTDAYSSKMRKKYQYAAMDAKYFASHKALNEHLEMYGARDLNFLDAHGNLVSPEVLMDHFQSKARNFATTKAQEIQKSLHNALVDVARQKANELQAKYNALDTDLTPGEHVLREVADHVSRSSDLDDAAQRLMADPEGAVRKAAQNAYPREYAAINMFHQSINELAEKAAEKPDFNPKEFMHQMIGAGMTHGMAIAKDHDDTIFTGLAMAKRVHEIIAEHDLKDKSLKGTLLGEFKNLDKTKLSQTISEKSGEALKDSLKGFGRAFIPEGEEPEFLQKVIFKHRASLPGNKIVDTPKPGDLPPGDDIPPAVRSYGEEIPPPSSTSKPRGGVLEDDDEDLFGGLESTRPGLGSISYDDADDIFANLAVGRPVRDLWDSDTIESTPLTADSVPREDLVPVSSVPAPTVVKGSKRKAAGIDLDDAVVADDTSEAQAPKAKPPRIKKKSKKEVKDRDIEATPSSLPSQMADTRAERSEERDANIVPTAVPKVDAPLAERHATTARDEDPPADMDVRVEGEDPIREAERVAATDLGEGEPLTPVDTAEPAEAPQTTERHFMSLNLDAASRGASLGSRAMSDYLRQRVEWLSSALNGKVTTPQAERILEEATSAIPEDTPAPREVPPTDDTADLPVDFEEDPKSFADTIAAVPTELPPKEPSSEYAGAAATVTHSEEEAQHPMADIPAPKPSDVNPETDGPSWITRIQTWARDKYRAWQESRAARQRTDTSLDDDFDDARATASVEPERSSKDDDTAPATGEPVRTLRYMDKSNLKDLARLGSSRALQEIEYRKKDRIAALSRTPAESLPTQDTDDQERRDRRHDQVEAALGTDTAPRTDIATAPGGDEEREDEEDRAAPDSSRRDRWHDQVEAALGTDTAPRTDIATAPGGDEEREDDEDRTAPDSSDDRASSPPLDDGDGVQLAPDGKDREMTELEAKINRSRKDTFDAQDQEAQNRRHLEELAVVHARAAAMQEETRQRGLALEAQRKAYEEAAPQREKARQEAEAMRIQQEQQKEEARVRKRIQMDQEWNERVRSYENAKEAASRRKQYMQQQQQAKEKQLAEQKEQESKLRPEPSADLRAALQERDRRDAAIQAHQQHQLESIRSQENQRQAIIKKRFEDEEQHDSMSRMSRKALAVEPAKGADGGIELSKMSSREASIPATESSNRRSESEAPPTTAKRTAIPKEEDAVSAPMRPKVRLSAKPGLDAWDPETHIADHFALFGSARSTVGLSAQASVSQSQNTRPDLSNQSAASPLNGYTSQFGSTDPYNTFRNQTVTRASYPAPTPSTNPAPATDPSTNSAAAAANPTPTASAPAPVNPTPMDAPNTSADGVNTDDA